MVDFRSSGRALVQTSTYEYRLDTSYFATKRRTASSIVRDGGVADAVLGQREMTNREILFGVEEIEIRSERIILPMVLRRPVYPRQNASKKIAKLAPKKRVSSVC